MTITMDTNVLFSALDSNRGASHAIFRLILDEKISIALSTPIYTEYEAVLTRPENTNRLSLTQKHVRDILDTLALLARNHEVYFLLRPNLKDEADNMFWECAFASRSDYLVTANIKDFRDSELTGFPFAVVTPYEFLTQWSAKNE